MSEAPHLGRWQLHRGGVVNVWQYAVEEFDLSGGRAIFQGTNGSGKSRTLELLLPLCLDGDLRQIGSKGFDSVSMRKLMLDDYTGGPNRIGYVWVELRRDGAGGPEYLTTGVGVKASANSQQISDSWRFITERRIGDVNLVADGAPLGPTQLRDTLGADCVYDEEPFRAKVAELVFGVPAARYPDLLHLQRTLRNPDVGLKVLAGELERILSDSLPPLDPGLVEHLARSFDDLRSIRDNIEALATADTALDAFLSRYAGYVLGSLRTLGRRSAEAEQAVAAARREIRKLAERQEREAARAEELQDEVAGLEARESTVDSEVEGLKGSPAYDSVRDLADRKRAVGSERKAAVSALKQAQSQRMHADRLVDTVLAAVRRLAEDTTSAGSLAADVGERMREAGVDLQLCPVVPEVPEAAATEVTATQRVSPEPEEEPGEVWHRVPPELDHQVLAAGFGKAAEAAQQAVSVFGERSAVALSLLERARELDAEQAKVDALRHEAREAQLAGTEAAAERNEAAQRLDEAAQSWWGAASRWAGSGPLATLDEPEDVLLPPELSRLTGDHDASREAADQARAWMRKRLPDLRAELGRSEQVVRDLDGRITAAETELRNLRSGADPEAPLPWFTTAERDPDAGSAFYRLVDFAPGLDEADHAGCEAALEACGLLNAWVTADGSVTDPSRQDLHAAVTGPAVQDQPTLADVLVPAVPPGSPVPESVVRQLLERVALSDAGGAGLAVSASGVWRVGVLAGAMTKPAAQYVGAGAREAGRKRRIGELAASLEQLREELAAAEAAVTAVRERVEAWEDHIDAYPDDRGLVAAHAGLQNTKAAADKAGTKALSLRDTHAAAADRYQARKGALATDARTAGLDDSTESLDAALSAARQGRKDAEQLLALLTTRCLGGVETLTGALDEHRRAWRELAESDREAEEACRRYLGEKAAYDEVVGAIGGEAEELEHKLRALEGERTALRQKLPGLRKDATEAEVSAGKTQAQVEGKESRVAELVEREQATGDRFRAALSAEGVWSAAVGEESELPAENADALGVLESVERNASSEDAVMNALQTLQGALAGSHDVTVHRAGEVLTVTIAGERGRQPVAVAAHEIARRLEEQRNLLSDEYQQIFDRFMLRDLADKLAAQIGVAEDLCRRMNETLDVARSSQGVHVQLSWQPTPDLDEAMRQALQLVRKPFADRSAQEDERLRQALTERISAERDGPSGDYAEVLGRALDYRSWHRFTVRVRDEGPDGAPRTRRMRQLSSGETRLISYVTLFAAASAFYDAVSAAAERPPLRLVLLDEAFERLDDPTIARMLGLLVDLDMDWVITWPSGWGLSEKIPRMHIYDILRPKGGTGIACTHAIWNGNGLSGQDAG